MMQFYLQIILVIRYLFVDPVFAKLKQFDNDTVSKIIEEHHNLNTQLILTLFEGQSWVYWVWQLY